ncbi:putative 2-dehydropantoate 2-reductase [Viscerimonas tarda]
MSSLRYAVIGSGAIGGFYGGMLVKAGEEVHFLFHSDYEYVKANGFSIDSVNGNFSLNPVLAYEKTSDMPACDVVLVCLKSTNNKLLKTLLPPIIHPGSLVILIQNGLGIEADLQQEFPNLAIAGGMAFICSGKTGAGHVAHMAYGKLSLGIHTLAGKEMLEKVIADFVKAGVETELVDLPVARWKKLVWNIPYNGMTVVLNTTTDKLMSNKHTRQLIYDLMLEVIRAGNKVGSGAFSISESFADEMMYMTDNMAPYSPSMKLDFDLHRPLEIEYIYSRPVEITKEAGCEMPRVSMLEKQLQFIQSWRNFEL